MSKHVDIGNVPDNVDLEKQIEQSNTDKTNDGSSSPVISGYTSPKASNTGITIVQPQSPHQINLHPKTPRVPEPLHRMFGRGGPSHAISGHAITLAFNPEALENARAEAASWAQMTPLMAATLGPLAVLLGIPTLTQPWRGRILDPPMLESGASNYVALSDPTLNLVLAGASLFCEVAGNGLLVLRFSNFHTKITTWVSYAFWIAKIALGVANYISFGIEFPQSTDIIYLEGFWVFPSAVI